jgi:ATP-dependent RNA/DNA helicase IGHMBP2
MNSAVEELGILAQALVEEQREEERRLAAVLEKQSLRIRKAEGLTWAPVTIETQHFTFGGRVKLTLQKGQNGGLDDAFRSGSPVHFYQANDAGLPADERAVRRGIVRKIRGGTAAVILDGNPLEAAALHERWTLDERADDRTYRLMAEALSHWINTEDDSAAFRRNGLLGLGTAQLPVETKPIAHPSLNPGQRTWVAMAEAAEQLVILHGPPGTGKTTTLLAFVQRAVERGERLLLAASSNAAVDLLVKGCVRQETTPVRIGHPVRLDADVVEYGLDAHVEKDPEFKQVKDMRKRAEKVWKQINTFHRNFGAAQRAERNAARSEARSLESEANAMEAYLSERVVRTSQVVCATLTGCADDHLKGQSFDWVVIDEASQAMLPAALIAMQRGPRLILAGDPYQLPPVVKSDEARANGLEVSVLERAMRGDHNAAASLMLTDQYRMVPDIMQLASDLFYDGRLCDARAFDATPAGNAVQFIDTAGCGFDEDKEPATGSTCNPDEAGFLVQRLVEVARAHPSFAIAVIAPYRAQVDALNRCIDDACSGDVDLRNRIECSTVDAFQGQERDVVFISLTRSNASGEIGFLKEYRRMNVAMTRAKHRLLIIGDGATVGQDVFYADLFEAAESRGFYHSAWEWMSM